MRVEEFRIYVECYEQGLDLRDYLLSFGLPIKIVSVKKNEFNKYRESSIVAKFKNVKSFDAFITFIFNEKEYPFLAFEYSTAVPTDDHIQQRFDGIYWAAKLQIPFVKISPTDINNTDFGGGTKLTSEHEILASLDIEGIYKHFNWPLVKGTDFTDTNPERVSCPKFLAELKEYINEIKNMIGKNTDYKAFYLNLYNYHKKKYQYLYNKEFEKERNSERTTFLENNKFILKFNRFGHGMDPERGMLFYYYYLRKRISIKFDMYRGDIWKREKISYHSLYDRISSYQKIKTLIEKNKFKLTQDDYLKIFSMVLSYQELFENAKIENNLVIINDEKLEVFLKKSRSNSFKSLFIFGEEIILSGETTQVLIKWNKEITNHYYKRLINIENFQYKKLPVTLITNELASEDIITYIIQEFLRRRYKYEIIGVSYPGAQGDRVIKDGDGRKNNRDFIDIIAYKDGQILLIEAKEKLSDSVEDIEKLKAFILNEEKVEKMKTLVKTLSSNYDGRSLEMKIGICGKGNSNLNIDKTMLMIQANPANPNNLEEYHLILTYTNKENLIQNDLYSFFDTVYTELYYVI